MARVDISRALMLCELNLLDGTATEILDSLRHFAPGNLVAPVL